MPGVVLVRTRWTYDSYQDFWRLAELSGMPVCYIDEIDLRSDTVYVVTPMNGETRPAIDAARSRTPAEERRALLAWWALERPDEPNSGPFSAKVDEALRFFDEVWVSDAHFASLDGRLRHVVLGSHPNLREGQRSAIRFDFAHMSYVCVRRIPVMAQLQRRFRVAPNGWGAERAAALNASRAMVNVHQTPAPIGEPLRFAVASAFGLPLLTETLADPRPLVSGVHFVECSIAAMAAAARAFLGRPDLPALGASLYEELCVRRPFGRCIEEAVAALVSKHSSERAALP